MKSIEEIRDMLECLGKLKLGFYPTPFHRLDRISGEYGVELYVKREDFSGMTLFGGNKIRKLESIFCTTPYGRAATPWSPTGPPSPTTPWRRPLPPANAD